MTPGLIDMHVHVFEHATPIGINADQYCIGRGVTTVVDAGSCGSATIAGLRHYVAASSQTRVLAMLNISAHGLASAGMSGMGCGGELDSLNQVNADATVAAVKANRDMVCGIKIRLSLDCADDGANEAEAYRRAREAAQAARVPLMTHHTFSGIELGGPDGCPGGLQAGDIYVGAGPVPASPMGSSPCLAVQRSSQPSNA